MPTLDSIHATRIADAIDHLNMACAAGLSPVADCLAALDAVEALQADLRCVLEAERRRGMMTVA
jgi:hypothetical protein